MVEEMQEPRQLELASNSYHARCLAALHLSVYRLYLPFPNERGGNLLPKGYTGTFWSLSKFSSML